MRRIAFFMAVAASLLPVAAASAQLRVVTYNVAGLRGNMTALQNVITAIHEDDKPGFAVPIGVIMFQEVQNPDFSVLASVMTAAAPPGVTYIAGTYTTSGTEDNSSGAQAMFFRSDMLTEQAGAHVDISTGAGRNADRWLLRLNGYLSTQAWFYTYSSHLKADTGAANEALRLTGVQNIRANAATLGATAHVIYAGDQNFYNNTETGYLHYLSAGIGQAFDPLGSGSWAGGTQANNLKHSQSPLFTSVNGLVGGGINDRFDFQLITAPFNDGDGLAIIPGTYRSLGNDGLHLNQAINNNTNFYYPGNPARSNALAANLVQATDHIPVIVDFQIPAVMTATMSGNYGRVIQGASFALPIQVMNAANVVVAIGADALFYNAAASGALSGVASDTVQALGDVSEPTFALDTATVGVRNGSVLVTSTNQAVQNPSITLNTTGTIVRHANASFDSASDLNEQTVAVELEAGTGVHQFNVDVHNLGFDSLQALLDVDGVSAIDAPFEFIGGLEDGVGSTPATLGFAFDTAGLRDGRYSQNITIQTSDEDLAGATGANLLLTFNVTIGSVTPCPADVNGSNAVDIDDLLMVINAWGSTGTPGTVPGDVNANGIVDIDDLLAVISAWGNCP